MLNAVNTFEKVFQDDGIAFLAALKSDEVHKIINHGPPRHAMSPTFVKNFDEVTMSYQSDIQKGAEMVTNHTHMEIEFEGLLQQQETHYMRAFSSLVCLLYTSDAADEEDSVDLGGRRIIKKKKII
eukprot:TRINITY_DN11106_c0_g1_i1.p1 TRINITY_DN11106_c0_g1~~TRINITY_DN11106_c0_g1_i1.p1  ORF type:complete len:126 (+),score=32.32 TRINITY_DN11106_c0_g1_i1:298-675(+)